MPSSSIDRIAAVRALPFQRHLVAVPPARGIDELDWPPTMEAVGFIVIQLPPWPWLADLLHPRCELLPVNPEMTAFVSAMRQPQSQPVSKGARRYAKFLFKFSHRVPHWQ